MIYVYICNFNILKFLLHHVLTSNKRIPTLSLFESKEIIFSNRKYVRNI